MLTFSISQNLLKFKSLMTLVAKQSDAVRFRISDSGILFEGTDQASYSLLFIMFKSSLFDKFSADKMFDAWFSGQHFIKILKLVDTAPIEVIIDDNYLRMKVVEKNKETNVSLRQQAPERIEELPSIHMEEGFDLQLRMNVVTLRSMLKDIENLGGRELYISWSQEGFKISGKEDIGESEFSILLKREKSEIVEFSKIGEGSAAFRLDLLENIVWAELGEITFSIMKKDTPLFIESHDNDYSLRFVVAPFITENPEREDSWEKTIPMVKEQPEGYAVGQVDSQPITGGNDDGETEQRRPPSERPVEWKSVE